MKKIIRYLKGDVVLCAAIILALVSSLFVKPDREYLGYIDYKTLALLFCLMVVMAGFQEIGVFGSMGEKLLGKVHTKRQVAGILVFLCFFSSMVITNDVALIIFVPFGITILGMAGMEREIVPVVVMQTVAANLGSMATPIGNPQNLYLYTKSDMEAGKFIALMLPFTLLALGMLLACLLFFKNDKIFGVLVPVDECGIFSGKKFIIYGFLFLICVGAVARIIPWYAAFCVVIAIVALMERKIFLRVDYTLLLTFAGFFIFIGNLGRMEAFCAVIVRILEGQELLASIAASQVISNVPAALLLSGFTDEWNLLIVGTNLGGLGTLIASMASLISYKYIAREHSGVRGKYLVSFTAVNVLFLAGLSMAAIYLLK